MTADANEPQRAMSKDEIDKLFNGEDVEGLKAQAGEGAQGDAEGEVPESEAGEGGDFEGAAAPDLEEMAAQPVELDQLQSHDVAGKPQNIQLLMDVKLPVTVELGRNRLSVKDILEFGPGSIVELDRAASEPVDVLVNGVLVAHGEVVVIEDHFGVRLTSLISPEERIRSLGKDEG